MTSSGFRAVANAEARILILGTLPGAASLAKREYYAQPRNAFWPIMATIADFDPDLPYRERLERLVAGGYAIWDVCAQATRSGSLDSAISAKSVRVNDFASFFASHPKIHLVCFNGAKARTIFERKVRPTLGIQAAAIRRLTLPSTSPAYAALSLPAKTRQWHAALKAPEA